jgi:hypothetical protein
VVGEGFFVWRIAAVAGAIGEAVVRVEGVCPAANLDERVFTYATAVIAHPAHNAILSPDLQLGGKAMKKTEVHTTSVPAQ